MNIEYDTSSDGCFVCGKGNAQGLRLDFAYDGGREGMCARCTFPDHMQGYDRIVHGGFISMLLDEAMAKACLQRDLKAVTARMEVRFAAPVYVGEEVRFCGRIEEARGRRVCASAVCEDEGGRTRATANALFIRG